MTSETRERVILVGGSGGALVALVQGFTTLECASPSGIVISLAASFGAGAALAVLLMQRRHRASAAPGA